MSHQSCRVLLSAHKQQSNREPVMQQGNGNFLFCKDVTMTPNPEQAEHFRTSLGSDWSYWHRQDKGLITLGRAGERPYWAIFYSFC